MFGHLVMGAATTLGDMIVTSVSFLILLVLLRIFAWKPLMNVMKQREDHISSEIDSAENARAEANRLVAEQRKQIDATRDEAATILSNAKEASEREHTALIQDAYEEIERKKRDAKQNIASQKKEAMDEVKEQVAALSLQIASKLIEKNLSTEDHNALVDEFIEGLGDQDEVR